MAFLQEQNAQFGGNFGDKLPKLWLKDGDQARFWFLYGVDEMVVPLVHMETKWSKRKSKSFNVDVICGKDRIEDPDEKCPRCVAQAADHSDTPKLRGPFPRGVFVVWVDVVGYKNKPEAPGNYRPVKAGSTGKVIYLDNWQKLALFTPGRKLVEQFVALLEGNVLANALDENAEAGGPVDILVQPFRLSVTGEGTGRSEVITVEAKTAIPEAVRGHRSALPDLDTILRNEYGTLPGKVTLAAGRPAAAAGAQGAPDEAVEIPGDEEGATDNSGPEDYDF